MNDGSQTNDEKQREAAKTAKEAISPKCDVVAEGTRHLKMKAAIKSLIALGGSDPSAEGPPRRRSFE
jgi:hypothetical protein